MTRDDIYDSIWRIAQKEVASHGFRFASDAERQIKEFIRHGVYNNMTSADVLDSIKIAEAERNMREICQELCRRERQRNQHIIVEGRTFVEMRFQFCPRYPFC